MITFQERGDPMRMVSYPTSRICPEASQNPQRPHRIITAAEWQQFLLVGLCVSNNASPMCIHITFNPWTAQTRVGGGWWWWWWWSGGIVSHFIDVSKPQEHNLPTDRTKIQTQTLQMLTRQGCTLEGTGSKAVDSVFLPLLGYDMCVSWCLSSRNERVDTEPGRVKGNQQRNWKLEQSLGF